MAQFSDTERKKLLAARYVGKTFLQHIEGIGISTLAQLRELDSDMLARLIAHHTGIAGWETHRLALQAIDNALCVAHEEQHG